MPATTTPNEKPAEATIPGGLDLVLTTLSPTPGKGEDHDLVQPQHTRVQR